MNTSDLIKIMDDMAADGQVFVNEQDFQFNLGKRIRKMSEVKAVYFEVSSFSTPLSSISDKEDTDIIVELKDGSYIAIELKYKTPYKICTYTTKQGTIKTLKQGAYDFGVYYFLNDVVRLENINKRYFNENIDISKGFAILLTNDKNYRFNCFIKSKIWSEYSLCQYKSKIGSGLLTFKSKGTSYLKFSALTLLHQYDLENNWNDYRLIDSKGAPYNDYDDKDKSNHPGFSYLIFEINKTSKEGD